MTTNDKFLFSNDKRRSFVNDVTDKQYSNLNLNQSYKTAILIPVQSGGNISNDKRYDSTVSDNCEENEKQKAWNKSSNLFSKTLNINGEAEKWGKKDESAKCYSLSPYIEAYENSREIVSDTFSGKKLRFRRKITKENFCGLEIQNSFEFPRQQQEDRQTDPEMAGFKASQKLLNPNQASSSNTAQQPLIAIPGDSAAQLSTDIPGDSADRLSNFAASTDNSNSRELNQKLHEIAQVLKVDETQDESDKENIGLSDDKTPSESTEERCQNIGLKVSKEQLDAIIAKCTSCYTVVGQEELGPKIGENLDGFLIRTFIGSGGNGKVYAAERDGQLFAIKCAVKEADLQREYQMLMLCSEKAHILKTCYYGEREEYNFIVLKLMGPELRYAVDEVEKEMTDEEFTKYSCSLFSKTLYSLQELHSAGIVHQDVKFENFTTYIEDPDSVCIIDLGSSKLLSESHRNHAVGTFWYASRDAIDLKPQYAKCDIESLFYCFVNFIKPEACKWFTCDAKKSINEKKKVWESDANKMKFLHGFPEQFLQIMNYIDGITPDAVVNYKFIQDLLEEIAKEKCTLIDAHDRIPYKYFENRQEGLSIKQNELRFYKTDKTISYENGRLFSFSCGTCKAKKRVPFMIYVDKNDYENAGKDDLARIIKQSRPIHECIFE